MIELCPNSCIMHKNRTQSLNCTACAQLRLVYCSVHETCAERFLLHYSVGFCSPYPYGRKKTKNTLIMTFSVYFPYLCAELVQPRSESPKSNRTQSYALCSINDVSMTHQWNNVHWFDSCVIGRHVTLLGLMPIQQDSERHGEKQDFGVTCVSLHKEPRNKMFC